VCVCVCCNKHCIAVSLMGTQWRVGASWAQQSSWPCMALTSYSCIGFCIERVCIHTHTHTHTHIRIHTLFFSLHFNSFSPRLSLTTHHLLANVSSLLSHQNLAAVSIFLFFFFPPLFFFLPFLIPPSGGESAASALCLPSTLEYTHTHTHTHTLTEFKGQMTSFSLLSDYSCKHTYIWGRGRSQTHTHAQKCSNEEHCIYVCVFVREREREREREHESLNSCKPNEGVSHHDSSSTQRGLIVGLLTLPHTDGFLSPPYFSYSILPQPSLQHWHLLITISPLFFPYSHLSAHKVRLPLCLSPPSFIPMGSGWIIGSRGSSLRWCWGQSGGKPS